jgi:hypothetical protein
VSLFFFVFELYFTAFYELFSVINSLLISYSFLFFLLSIIFHLCVGGFDDLKDVFERVESRSPIPISNEKGTQNELKFFSSEEFPSLFGDESSRPANRFTG